MIISINTKNVSDKIANLFMILKKQTLNKLEIERNFLNLRKKTYEILTPHITLNGEKL